MYHLGSVAASRSALANNILHHIFMSTFNLSPIFSQVLIYCWHPTYFLVPRASFFLLLLLLDSFNDSFQCESAYFVYLIPN